MAPDGVSIPTASDEAEAVKMLVDVVSRLEIMFGHDRAVRVINSALANYDRGPRDPRTARTAR